MIFRPIRRRSLLESLCTKRKRDIIGDMKKEYEATNYESDLTDEQWEAIKEFFPSGNKSKATPHNCQTSKNMI